MRQCRRSGAGRRKSDNSGLYDFPCEDRQRVLDDVAYMLHESAGAREWLEEAIAKAQAEGIFLDNRKELV